MEPEPVLVVVLDHEGCRSGTLDDDTATTLIAVASEDPADWSEMVNYWPRYTTRVVPEFASSLPIDRVPREQVLSDIGATDSWIVLDLVQKRYLSGKQFQMIERDACFAMHTDENGDQHDPLSIHFAPWWELHEQVDASAIDQPRQSPAEVPFVDREVLFGPPLVEALAKRIVPLAATDRFRTAIEKGSEKRENENPLYNMTIEVHRDWLMTPRDDLNGMIPRQMLHGGASWIDNLVWGHRMRFERAHRPIVAVPTGVSGYRNGPMGSEERAIYFDLCRALIEAGWQWCESNLDALEAERLIPVLIAFKSAWLVGPLEGGSPPAFIIECSRRRVPRGAGVEIVGMSERETEEHMVDCDCPICQMMADGFFGVGFAGIDGHHLDLDDEFAFSTCETREEWEAEQQRWADQSAQWEREREERERKLAAGELEEDEFASAWTGMVSDEAIPGDDGGNLKLAFFVAEIVGELKNLEAPHELIVKLNADFSSFRKSELRERETHANDLTATLELVADDYPELVPRIADLESRIAEQLRAPVPNSGDDDDCPF